MFNFLYQKYKADVLKTDVLARKEQEGYDAWQPFKALFKGLVKYILLPMVTIFLTEYFKVTNLQMLMTRAVLLVLVCLIIVLVLSAFAAGFQGMFNPNIHNLDEFIYDIKNIELFPAKVDQYIAQRALNKKCNE
jgi:uncharacterized membrane protein YfhO